MFCCFVSIRVYSLVLGTCIVTDDSAKLLGTVQCMPAPAQNKLFRRCHLITTRNTRRLANGDKVYYHTGPVLLSMTLPSFIFARSLLRVRRRYCGLRTSVARYQEINDDYIPSFPNPDTVISVYTAVFILKSFLQNLKKTRWVGQSPT